jgi:hypothetical protein
VIDFAKRPAACPRLDVHAVYLGRPGPDPICPAGLVGRTEAVMVGPLADGAAAFGTTGAKARMRRGRMTIVRGDSAVTRTLADRLPAAGVQVAISYGTNRPLALAIQSSIRPARTGRRAGPGPAGPGPAGPGPAGTAWTTRAELLAHSEFRHAEITRARAKARWARLRGQGTFAGSGFDSCAAPSAGTMTKWLGSRYRAVGIYIGGANRACAQAYLTPSWLTAIAAQGWRYFPIYPGLQSSCVLASGDATITTRRAGSEGRAAAEDAVAQASALGIPPGTPLIYDMEAYGPACDSQVITFLSAWDGELRARGYVSGVYESFTNVGALVTAAGSMTEPQVIYYADWDGKATTASSYMPSAMWANHQRLHQYQGNHVETYGGVSIDIDADQLDVNLGGAPIVPRPGGYARFRIAEGVNANGTAEWFARSASGALAHAWQAPVGSLTWSAMHAVGRSPGTIASNPSVAPQADGALTLYARDNSGRIVHAWQQAGFPNDWEWGKPLPAPGSRARGGTDPAALLLPSGDVAVFQSAGDGSVDMIRQRRPNGNGRWTGWRDLRGNCASSPVPVADPRHDVDVFCVTTGGSAATIGWNGRSWGQWSTLTQSPADLTGVPSVAVDGSGQVEFFAATKAGGLDDAWQNGAGTWTWGAPLVGANAPRTATVTGSPAAAAWPVGRVIVYAKLATGQVSYIRQDGTSAAAAWSAWSPIPAAPGGQAAGSPLGWLNTPGAASVAIVDRSGKLAVSSDGGTGWSAWTQVGSGF